MEHAKADITLHEEGLAWPMFLLRARKAMDSMERGQVLEVVSSTTGLMHDVPELFRRLGHGLLLSRSEDGSHYFYFRKS
jgi:TusA-related sulfurtransferase